MKPQTAATIAAAMLSAFAWAQAAPDAATPPAPQSPRVAGSQIILPAGAWIRMQVDQPISSDHNRPGDGFTGTLAQPVVADGYIVAHRGQTIEGRVTEALKAGKTKGTSRLGLELIEVSLADGQQMPIRTQLIEYNGGTSVGRDVAAIGTTTGMGAAIGGAAAGGVGAGIGALAGAAASGIGVLLTRGRATEIYPETVVAFRTTAPVTISTERAPHAFQPVRQSDYERNTLEPRPAAQQRPAINYGIYGGVPPYPAWGWGGPWYGGYWGAPYYGGVGVVVGGAWGGGYGHNHGGHGHGGGHGGGNGGGRGGGGGNGGGGRR